jgi:hypothetical protein
MDGRNRYTDNNEIKWIVAQKERGQDWKIRFLSTNEFRPTLDHILDVTPACQIQNSEFGVFKNRENWWEYRPNPYYRGFEQNTPISVTVGSLINIFESDHF